MGLGPGIHSKKMEKNHEQKTGRPIDLLLSEGVMLCVGGFGV